FLEVRLFQLMQIRGVELGEITRHALLQLPAPFLDLRRGEILVRLLTALNFDPSIARLTFASRPIWRQSSTNRAHTFLIAAPLSLRKSAIVLWSGASRPSSHITSRLRWHSRSRRRLD